MDLVGVELIPFLVSHYGEDCKNQHWGKNQNQDAAAQSFDDALTGSGGLRVAQRTVLREKSGWR